MRRILLLAVSIITCAALIAGCSGGPGTTAPATTAPATTAPATTASAGSETQAPTDTVTPPEANGDPMGKYENTVTVKMGISTNQAMIFPEGDSYENNVWTRSILSDMNIKIEHLWSATGGDKYTTKLNLAIATNDLPDIFTTSTYAQFDKMVKAGMLQDIGPVIDKYMSPALKGYWEMGGTEPMNWGKVNGTQFGYPNSGVNTQSQYMVYIRKDWFDKLGMAEPKTMDDVVAIAKAFATAEKGRVALPLSKTPLADGFSDLVGMANAYGAFMDSWYEDGSGQLIYGNLQPGMKKALAVYADLFKNGFIDPAFASYDGNKVAEQMTSGKVGVILGQCWVIGWPLNQLYEQEGVDWLVYPLMNAAENTNPVRVQTSPVVATFHVVRAGYEYPEILMKLLNYEDSKVNDPVTGDPKKFHSDETYAYHMMAPLYGIPGEPNVNLRTQKHVTEAIDTKNEAVLTNAHDKLQYGNVKTYFDTKAANGKITGTMWADYRNWYGTDSMFGILNTYYDTDMNVTSKLVGVETDEMVRSWANLKKLTEQAFVEFITGVRPIEDFDKYVQEWRDMGGAVVEVEVNQWYKSQK